MSENNINRIERKVDLLYKFLLDLYVPDIGLPYDMDYLWEFSDEIISVFNLDVKENYLNFDFKGIEELAEKKNKIKSVIDAFDKGNYLAKEKDALQNEIRLLRTQVDLLEEIDNNREQIKETIKKLNTNVLQKMSMYTAFRKKLGLHPEVFQTSTITEKIK